MNSSRITGGPDLKVISLPGKKTTAKNKSPGSRDEVELSDDVALLQNAEAAADDSSGVDEALVAEMKDAILRGDLKLDAEKLAHKMLEFEDEIFRD